MEETTRQVLKGNTMTEKERQAKIKQLKELRKAYHEDNKKGSIHERALVAVHCMELQMRQEKLERGGR